MKRRHDGSWGVMRSLWVVVLLAGCTSGSTPPADTDADPLPTEGRDQEIQEIVQTLYETSEVEWSGQTKEGYWVCSDQDGISQCSAGQQVNPDGRHVQAIPYTANLTTVDLNMTWNADPGQTGLVLAAYGNTTAGRGLLGYVRGTSPLALRLEPEDLTGLLPDNLLVLMVWPEGKTPTEPSLFVDATRQAYEVVGSITTMDQVVIRQTQA